MKKILLGFGTLAVALAVAPLFAAFEAHVVNVTATIENALAVPLRSIDFGTVFPQEHLNKPLGISLSQSFIDEDRVDDVDYIIRQKPKCGVTTLDGQTLVEGSTQTGHVIVGDDPATPDVVETYWIDCGTSPIQFDPATHQYGLLPMLCPYISKLPDGQPGNDGRLPSFHDPFVIENGSVKWNDTKGHLAKSQNDTTDNWIIDLAVPCFGGQCAQDWADFVADHNDLADPKEFIQDPANEHKVFGCDLWVEVAGISLPGLGCKGKIDLMLVLDRSGSIGSGELTSLKTAAKAFVDALAPSAAGVHIGQTSFSTTGSLDLHLSDNSSTIKAAIDALVAVGFTNLKEGIDLAKTELDNPGDGHDRPDGDSLDFMVIITDGAPNEPGTDTEARNAAASSSLVARAAGVEIFVVGVGTTTSTADYLKMKIVSAPVATHYFDAADYASLGTVLTGLAACTP